MLPACRCELDPPPCPRPTLPFVPPLGDHDDGVPRGPVDWDVFFSQSEKSTISRHGDGLASSCLSTASTDILFGTCCSGTTMARRFMGGGGRGGQSPDPPRMPRNLTYDQKLAEEEARMQGASQTPIGRWLAARNLQRYEAGLARMGVKRVADLVYLTDEDMDNLNVDPESRMHFYVRVIA